LSSSISPCCLVGSMILHFPLLIMTSVPWSIWPAAWRSCIVHQKDSFRKKNVKQCLGCVYLWESSAFTAMSMILLYISVNSCACFFRGPYQGVPMHLVKES
jgi:hypothetical protein